MKSYNKKQAVISSVIIFILTVSLSVGACFLYSKVTGELLRITVFSALYAFILIFVFGYEMGSGHFDYDNTEHPYRFLFIYIASLLLALLFPFIDKAGWLFVSLAVCLSLFSDICIGITAVSGLIALSTMLSGSADIYTFLVYFFASLIGITVFRRLDEDFQVVPSIILTMSCLFVLETAGFVFLLNEKLSAEQFIFPIVNIFINSIILFVALKYFNEKIANRYRNKYLELNDQEYAALIRLKDADREEYMKSIHTAYLTERIAASCGCNVSLAKNLALYHKIKKTFKFDDSTLEIFVKDNCFPPDAAKALIDYCSSDRILHTKEESIVFLSDKLIATLMLIFSKNTNANIDYIEVIDAILQKPSIVEALSESDLSRSDLGKLESIMKKEVLYYDFLR